MNKRENMLRALRRDNPESVPFDFELCPSQIENFEKETEPEITESISTSPCAMWS